MGRKSRHKQNPRETIGLLQMSKRRQQILAFSIILPAAGLMVWSLKLMDSTFIPDHVPLIAILAGSTVGSITLYFAWKKYQLPIGIVVFYGSMIGAAVFLFPVIGGNYYLSNSDIVETTSPILKTGENKRRRHGRRCTSVYVVVHHNNLGNKVKFPCNWADRLKNHEQVKLRLFKGFFGYYVINSYELITPPTSP